MTDVFHDVPTGEWSVIPNCENFAVSPEGRIINRTTFQERATSLNQNGARMVTLTHPGGRSTLPVATLVANAFLPGKTEIMDTPTHRDGDKSNCHVDNLMWRPRWFAVLYHKQFNYPNMRTLLSVPVYIVETDEIFENSWDAAMKYGLLNHQIVESLAARPGMIQVFPYQYTFEYAPEPDPRD